MDRVTACRRIAAIFLLCLFAAAARSQAAPLYDPTRVVKGVVGEGTVAIVNMTPEQAVHAALLVARARAVEKAAGAKVVSTTVVRDFALIVDLAQSWSRGYIVAEEVKSDYQVDRRGKGVLPLIEAKVSVVADVYVPVHKEQRLGLKAALSTTVFRKGEKAHINVSVSREARVAVFNLRADNKVSMLFPYALDGESFVAPGRPARIPADNSPMEIEMDTLPGHPVDAEAFLVVALSREAGEELRRFFRSGYLYGVAEFFGIYAGLSEHAEEVILAYEVRDPAAVK